MDGQRWRANLILFFQQLIYAPIYNFYVNTVMKYYSGMNLLESHERILQAMFYPIPTTNPSHVRGRRRSAASEVKLQEDLANFWLVVGADNVSWYMCNIYNTIFR